jgi:dipeptidase E
MGYTFYVLEDGSYVLSDETGETLYGNAYVIRDGKMEMICSEDESVKLS